MRVYLEDNGPHFTLNKDDIVELKDKKYLDSFNSIESTKSRLTLVNHDPNCWTIKNGCELLIDPFCCSGARIRRYPERCCHHDYREIKLYVLRLTSERLENLIRGAEENWLDGGFLFSRDRYDRFSVVVRFLD